MKETSSRARWMVAALLAPWLVPAVPLVSAQMREPVLRLSEVIEEARQHNPGLAAAADRARAALSVPARVSALEDPVLSYEVWNAPESLRLDRADNNIFRLAQKVPFPGKRALAGEVASQDAAMVEKDARAAELDVVAGVTKAYYTLWQVHRLIAVYTREKDLVQSVTRIAEQKYGTSEVSQSDVLRAQGELTHLINRLQTETLAIRSAEAELREALSRPGTEPLGIPEDPPPPRLEATLESLTDLAESRRPEIAAQTAAVRREEASVRLAERARLPDFEFSVGRFENTGSRDGFGAMASMTLPIAQRAKYDAGVSEANARLSATKAERRRVGDHIRREVNQAYVRVETALAQYRLLTTTHVPQVEQALAVTESGYRTGAVDFLSLVDSLRQIEMIHTEHIESQAEFERAYADLERAVGSDIPRPPARKETRG